MPKYTVRFQDIAVYNIDIEAETEEAAINKVYDGHFNNEDLRLCTREYDYAEIVNEIDN